ncbi:MAG: sulfatase [Acidobacteriales bacterium]|nr:sulfatase [Terriglobales bacterium]
MDRRSFLSLAAALPARGAAARPFDVLFIAIEDLATCQSCYGNPVCRTPNLDALAAGGVRFDNAQCAFPLCNPTRSALLSGLRPPTTGVLGNSLDWNTRLRPGTTLPEIFRAGGYETVRVGKIFHAANGPNVFDDSARWSRVIPEREGVPKPSREKDPAPRVLFGNVSAGERRAVYDYRAWVWGPQGRGDLDCNDGAIAEQGVRVLSKKPGDKPLFLALGFHRPHLPLHAPAKYFEMYPPASIPLPRNPERDPDDLPHKYGKLVDHAMTDATRREAIAAYYACVTYVDACIGRVMAALKSSGRDRNTVVVVFGDHGFHIGEHRLWQKMTLFEQSCRVPLIISVPGVTKPAVCRRPAECVDIFPTLAELCGLKPPAGIESISMVPLLRNPARPWKKGAFTYINNGKTVRTERWRYTEWGGPDRAELYDREADPGEFTNLARDTKHASTAAELSRLLEGDWRAALPPA